MYICAVCQLCFIPSWCIIKTVKKGTQPRRKTP
nr:MAG TPA: TRANSACTIVATOR PROTEIN (TAT) (TAT EIAVY) REGULATION [Caudoviricetes sp.]DAP73328.1 MAG TPA: TRANSACTIVATOR PROTEIN (TAT) (TAT EIAVY) REGULATION [Caudoviricetes sp.]DAU32202.1 MAG TPA: TRANSACTIVATOR PROTEIN (TAT) (TAT EIAVY) REGULATION [Caudoviricetes sp.]